MGKSSKLYLSFFIATLILSISLVFGNSPKQSKKFQYVLEPKLNWEEKEVDALGEIITSYELAEDKSLNMSFSYFDQDLDGELQKTPLTKVVESLSKGKEFMFSMIGATEYKIIKSDLVSEKNFKILTIELTYKIDQKQFFVREKYFTAPEKVFLASFRSTKETNPNRLKRAESDFNFMRVKFE